MDGMNATAADAQTDLPGVGHNNPPHVPVPAPVDLAAMLDPDVLRDQIAIDHEPLLTRRDALLTGAKNYHDKFPKGPTNDEEAGKAGDFVTQINKCATAAKEAHSVAKKPFLEAGRTVDAVLKAGTEAVLRGAAALIGAKVTTYLQAKAAAERKRAQDEADRKAAEAQALADAAMAERNDQRAAEIAEEAIVVANEAEKAESRATSTSTDLSRTRGALGSVSSLRDKWTYKVDDLMVLVKAVAEGKAPLSYLTVNDAVVAASVRPKDTGVREIPGLTIFNDQKAGFR